MRYGILLGLFLILNACTSQDIYSKGIGSVRGNIMMNPNDPCQMIIQIPEVSVSPEITKGSSFSVTIDKCVRK